MYITYLENLLLMMLPNPMSPKPSSNMLMGSERDLLMIVGVFVIAAVALTQNNRTATKPTVDKIYRSEFFIRILLALHITLQMKPVIGIAIEMPGIVSRSIIIYLLCFQYIIKL